MAEFNQRLQAASFAVYRIVYLLHMASFEVKEIDKAVLRKEVKTSLGGVDMVYSNLKNRLNDIDFEDVFEDFKTEKVNAISNIFSMMCNMDEAEIIELEDYLINNKKAKNAAV